jgi:hypothetical protein
MVNDFNAEKLLKLGYITKVSKEDHIILVNSETNSEVIAWSLDGWMQFQCMAFDLGPILELSSRVYVLESINRIHEIALGARIVLGDNGEISVITDLIHAEVTDEMAAMTCNQLLFICDRIYGPLKLATQEGIISRDKVDSIFS